MVAPPVSLIRGSEEVGSEYADIAVEDVEERAVDVVAAKFIPWIKHISERLIIDGFLKNRIPKAKREDDKSEDAHLEDEFN